VLSQVSAVTAVIERRPAELCLPFAASPTSIARVRRALHDWLRRLNWPVADADDIVGAVYEALANVVDHAYYRASATVPTASSQPSRGVLYAWEILEEDAGYLQRRVTAVITDYGRWKPAAQKSGYRGFGLAIMNSNVDRLHIQPSEGGTTVILTSSAHPKP
jgi:serine/threonine-protein kinase RsbW